MLELLQIVVDCPASALAGYDQLHLTTERELSIFHMRHANSKWLLHKFLVRNLHNLRARCSSYFTDLTNSPVHNIQHEIHTLETVGMLYPSFDVLGRFKVFTGVSCSRGWSCESIKKEIINVLHCCYL